MVNTTIDAIIHDLASIESNDETFNQYAYGDDANNTTRRDNLKRYLQTMQERKSNTLMVMEAPGYRGCRLTGIPVTSRRVMLDGVPELKLFGLEQGYQDVTDTGFENIHGEQSATIVWDTLATIGRAPLIWNTYPFHPHKPDKPRSNRKPRKPETTLGGDYLRAILMRFKPEVIIAVGNVAEQTMISMGINCVKVRHPAQGGKNDFVAGMTKLLS